MQLPYKRLPKTLNIDGIDFPIRTDFRLWIMLPELEDLSVLFMGKNPSFMGYFSSEAIEKIVEFYHCGKKVERNEDRTNVLDFKIDENLIYAAFRQAYNIDLYDLEQEELHWYKFKTLLDGIPPNTALSKVIEIRAYDGDDPDYKKLRDKFALPKQLTEEQEAAGKKFEEVFK